MQKYTLRNDLVGATKLICLSDFVNIIWS